MKSQRLLITALAMNGILFAAAAFFFTRPEAPGEPNQAAEEPAGTNTRVISKTLVKTRRVFTNAPAETFGWQQVESPDYKTYIANLRALECPEETIRDIIVSDVNKLFAEKMKALRGENFDYKYWKAQRPQNSKEEFERQKKYRALEKEKTALLKDLLGVDPNKEARKEMGSFDYWESMYGFLSEDKKEKARDLQERYQEMQQGIWQRNSGGSMDEDDQKEIDRLRKQQMAEMAAFMTPQELEQYELRASQTASQLRYDLDGFDPNAEEFRQIYRLKKSREEDLAMNNYDPDDKALNDRRQKAQTETDKQVKEFLGEDRYKEYERAKAWEYKELLRLTERQGLPKESAIAVYDMKKAVEEQATKVRTDKSLTPEQRSEALKAMKIETEKAVAETLGETGFKKYRDRHGGWISNLVPRN